MVAVTVIGGYLGAGKTTLVNHLLRHADGVKLAVLVNEFGDLPIDADLIKGQSDNVISISGGCVCCSFGSDLVGALMDLPQMSPEIDHVLIEASGVALPGSIADTVSLLSAYRLDSVAVVADASTVVSRAADRFVGDTVERQLEAADLVILNKVDLVDRADLDALLEFTGQKAPRARTVSVRQGQVPIEVLLSHEPPIRNVPPRAPSHPHLHLDDPYLRLAAHLPPLGSARAFAQALAAPALGLLRAKGFVDNVDGSRDLIQVVGARWTVSPAPDTPGPARLVCIGIRERMSENAINDLIAAHAASNEMLLQGETPP